MFDKEDKIREKVLEGLEISYKKLIQNKKERNLEFVISENGEIVKLKAIELKCD